MRRMGVMRAVADRCDFDASHFSHNSHISHFSHFSHPGSGHGAHHRRRCAIATGPSESRKAPSVWRRQALGGRLWSPAAGRWRGRMDRIRLGPQDSKRSLPVSPTGRRAA